MKLIVPDYFGEFACIKGDCRHSCCIGWEIDIDAESLERFQNVAGDMGQRLRENIAGEGEEAHFVLGEGERCPFLNKDGLCDMIIELGEDCLCQICADHPRFRNFYSGRTEMGLGLCCEAAGRLILERETPFGLVALEDDGEAEGLDEDEEYLQDIREEMLEIVRDRTIPVEKRAEMVLECAGADFEMKGLGHWTEFLKGLERLDDNWAGYLDCVEDENPAPDREFDTAYEQLLAYLIFRHMPGALEDGDMEGRAAFCCIMWRIIRAIHGRCGGGMDGLIELCRMYSSEIEYSDENIGAILENI